MFGSALDKVTSFLDPRTVLVSLLPTLAFWAVAGALAGGQIGWSAAEHWWQHLSGGAAAVFAVVAVAGLVLSALLLSTREGALLTWFEGYWSGPAAPLARWAGRRRAATVQDLNTRLQELDDRIGDLDGEIDALTETVARLEAELQAAAAEQQQRLRRDRRAAAVDLAVRQAERDEAVRESDVLTERRYRNYPPDPRQAMPTRLGNILKAAEEYPRHPDRYAMDAVFFWPRLFAVLPDGTRSALSDARASMALQLNVGVLAFALGLGSAGVLIVGGIDAALIHPGAGFIACAPAGLLLSWLAYCSALAPARTYAELIRVAFDLYRGDLLAQLKFALPANLADERALWDNLAQLLYRGAASQPGILDAARTRAVLPPPDAPGGA